MLTQNPLICKFGAVEEGGSFNWVEKIEPEREHVSFPPFFSCHNIPFSSLSINTYVFIVLHLFIAVPHHFHIQLQLLPLLLILLLLLVLFLLVLPSSNV